GQFSATRTAVRQSGLAQASLRRLCLRHQPVPHGSRMTSDELVGKVAAGYLRQHLSDDDSTGVARYLLDCLTADQTAAVAKNILADATQSQQFEIKLPSQFVEQLGLPPEVLTNERTTYLRNAACDKPVLLLSNTGDDEGQSLKDLFFIDEPLLRAC